MIKIPVKTKKVLDKNTYFKSELARRLSPQRMQFDIHEVAQNDFLRRTIMIKNFPSVLIGKCILARIAQIKNTTFSMHIYPYDGSLGFLFNGVTNVKNLDMIDYDLSDLLQGSKERTEAALFNIMTYVWNRITRREGRVLFSVDELYLLVNRNNLTVANYMKEFIKQARKYDAIIGTATQNLGDFLDPLIEHISSPLFNNPIYKFIFYPSDLDLGKVKTLLRLKDGEVSCIKTPNRGRCLFKAGGENYYIQVDKLPYEEELFGKAGGR